MTSLSPNGITKIKSGREREINPEGGNGRFYLIITSQYRPPERAIILPLIMWKANNPTLIKHYIAKFFLV